MKAAAFRRNQPVPPVASSEELIPAIAAIAAPIRNREGDVVAAISIGTPVNNLTADRRALYVEWLEGAATKISMQNGYRFAANHSRDVKEPRSRQT